LAAAVGLANDLGDYEPRSSRLRYTAISKETNKKGRKQQIRVTFTDTEGNPQVGALIGHANP